MAATAILKIREKHQIVIPITVREKVQIQKVFCISSFKGAKNC